ncbi:hypothetical protein F5144DRAFT_544268 [Chaetomium tenue]|uniref:Uncharacterized protein n=1 Tax=Chaetomium tenue TaxID=1854479 RepID=A0ACB7PS32_9PEZI|nr:hypothetical protein F5144DRAFT_544268 [Chaetomium globosum]
MDRRQHALETYGTDPETNRFSGIEVVNNTPEKYYVSPEYDQKFPASERPPSAPKNKICGLSRPIFFLTIALSALAILVVGLGAGLGVALSKVQASPSNMNADDGNANAPRVDPLTLSSAVDTSASSPTSTPATTSTDTTATTTSSSTSSSRPKPSNICPSADNSVIKGTVGDVRYRVACDSDFTGSGKETLASFFAETWDNCLKLCNTMNYFQERTDVGCTWNVAGTGQQTPGTCWCLGGADKELVANVGNVAAVPL